MDKLIVDHMSLLQKYSILRADLSAVYQTAFVQLSRCRYNGIQLSTRSFRQDFEPFLLVKNTGAMAAQASPEAEDLNVLSNLLSDTHISSDIGIRKESGRPPMMDIQALPSSSLKKTVSSFDMALQKSVELCHVVCQLQAKENEIQELKKVELGNAVLSSNIVVEADTKD